MSRENEREIVRHREQLGQSRLLRVRRPLRIVIESSVRIRLDPVVIVDDGVAIQKGHRKPRNRGVLAAETSVIGPCIQARVSPRRDIRLLVGKSAGRPRDPVQGFPRNRLAPEQGVIEAKLAIRNRDVRLGRGVSRRNLYRYWTREYGKRHLHVDLVQSGRPRTQAGKRDLGRVSRPP